MQPALVNKIATVSTMSTIAVPNGIVHDGSNAPCDGSNSKSLEQYGQSDGNDASISIDDQTPKRHSPKLDLPQPHTQTDRATVHSYTQTPVAIIGMSCRLPGHIMNPKQFWTFMMASRVADTEPPASRFSLSGHYDASQKPYTMKTPGAMFMEDTDPADFDAGFFGINHMDASSMDPQQRQLMEVAYECLENAGIPLESLAGARLGCLVGANTVDYYDMTCRDPEDRTESPTLGSNRALLSNRISHFLNVHGPSISLDTACSSTLVALDMACLYLTTHQCDYMLVGGANMYLSPERNQDMGAMRPTASSTGRCHAFDSKADGYVAAEAINCVLLKRIDDAVTARDPIRAVIRGTSTNSAGRTPGIAMPNAAAQAAAIRAAYQNADIPEMEYAETGFLECHGTGTLVGDPIEVSGAASVFGAGRRQSEPLVIGSVKSNVGHSEGAAGLSGLIKSVLAIENNVIPGTATFLSPNPKIDFEGSKVRASRTAVPWPQMSKKRASINSFGFGGANAHAIIESPHYLLPDLGSTYVSSYVDTNNMDDDFFDFEEDSESFAAETPAHTKPQIVVLSANDKDTLKASITALTSHLLNPAVNVKLHDLAYTLSQRRSHLYQRAYSIKYPSSKPHVQISQDAFTICTRSSSKDVTIGFVFTGQGAQWPEMGRDLLKSFPIAMETVKDLEMALKELTEPPSWSLVEELTTRRSAAAFQEPEFSQPLVTALQLAYLAVLSQWGIRAKAVVGHSSGEIAAAAYCGYVTSKEAIQIAYLRGQAVKRISSQEKLGMLAVGLGADDVQKYIEDHGKLVQIACFNSPKSVTLSGTTTALEQVQVRLKRDSVFARMLLVNSAYHSEYMRDIGQDYLKTLKTAIAEPDLSAQTRDSHATMYSSVTGTQMKEPTSSDYWHRNMVSPVCFQQATSAMLRSKTESQEMIDFLVEIGPSDALSGPISQICHSISSSLMTTPDYSSVAKRGAESLLSLYETAARLFGAGSTVLLDNVNEYSHAPFDEPKMIVDLPNYAWNHSTKYWHESLASKDWRYRPFPRHDLLGTKILGTPWHSPIFRNRLRLKDNPWLEDHKLGEQVVFPGAAYIAMAMEAIYQHKYITAWNGGSEVPEKYQYRLKDIKFSRALVLDDSNDYLMISLSLSAVPGCVSSWSSFQISSLRSTVGLKGEDVWNTHATGLIRIEEDFANIIASSDKISPLRQPTSAKVWYKSMRDSGFNFGPSFQKHVAMEYTIGERKGRSSVDLLPPKSTFRQSEYVLHPACMDGCFQTVTSSVWEGDRSAVNAALVPFQIDSLTIPSFPGPRNAEDGISNASSKYVGTGRRDVMMNFASSCQVYHPDTGALILDMQGLRYAELDSAEDKTMSHTYLRLHWDVDIDLLPESHFEEAVQAALIDGTDSDANRGIATAQRVIDLVAHKTPNLNILEVNLDSTDATSLWLSGKSQARGAFSSYRYVATDARCVVATRKAYADLTVSNVDFAMLNLTENFSSSVTNLNLVIIRSRSDGVFEHLSTALANIETLLFGLGGWVLFVSPTGHEALLGSTVTEVGFSKVLRSSNILLARMEKQIESVAKFEAHDTHVVKLDSGIYTRDAQQAISALLPSSLVPVSNPFELPPRSRVLIMDEVKKDVLSKMTQHQWDILQHLISSSCSILWVTSGAQGPSVTQPTKALANGFFRTIRNEEPSLNILNLDVERESFTDPATIASIASCILLLQKGLDQTSDTEFSCRQGMMQISRVVPDLPLNTARDEDFLGRAAEKIDLHESSSMIRLQAERIGNIDSLHYHAVAPEPAPLRPNEVEIEIFASGVNFKEVAVTIGIIPENEFLLGGEGAGIVSRVAPDVTRFIPGQRVAFFEKGSFANRIIAKTEAVIGIQDNMTFEEAATIPCVFLTSYYSLIHLANIKRGNTVLIHSATGGVGISAIQLCQHLGATVYATVGTPEKRQFLHERFNIPHERIFSSRTPAFGAQILEHTAGRGIDVILNSLTGNLLDVTWRIVADGGTMVEIGKKDILDRASLSMEPFNRNASFRALDLSHEEISDSMIASLLHDVFQLIEAGFLRPISPIHLFSFDDIPSAFRFIRSGKHIGKLVISRNAGPSGPCRVPVRPAARSIQLRPDRCYVIIGGLRGLCSSLAIYLAKMGAKYLKVVSRSGEDARSQKVIESIRTYGCDLQVCKGDISSQEDVRKILANTRAPVGGIVQGAMVLRDRTFASMSIEEYQDVIRCKLQGTWNLHNTSVELELPLDFFTLLSSISGIYGSKGQANYAAANAFLDAFAVFRSEALGLPTNAVDLGVIEDVGYMSKHEELQSRYDHEVWHPINERLLRKILGFSIMQQQPLEAPNKASAAHTITGIRSQQPDFSPLSSDLRFSFLLSAANSDTKLTLEQDGNNETTAAILVMIKSGAEPRVVIDAATNLLNKYLVKSLRLSQDMNVSRPLSAYGIDSLAAVEFRNYVKREFGVELTTLEVVSASGLTAICEKIIARLSADKKPSP